MLLIGILVNGIFISFKQGYENENPASSNDYTSSDTGKFFLQKGVFMYGLRDRTISQI